MKLNRKQHTKLEGRRKEGSQVWIEMCIVRGNQVLEMNKTQRVLKNTDNVDKSLERMTKEKKRERTE